MLPKQLCRKHSRLIRNDASLDVRTFLAGLCYFGATHLCNAYGGNQPQAVGRYTRLLIGEPFGDKACALHQMEEHGRVVDLEIASSPYIVNSSENQCDADHGRVL